MRDQRGASNNGAKITESQAVAVKSYAAKRVRQRRIAQLTGVSRANVWNIIHGVSWVDIVPDLSIEVPPEEPVTSKWCPDCGIVKPLEEFHPRKRPPLYRASYCRTCHAARATQALRNDRLRAFATLGGKCACCGESRPEFLSFDHVNGGGTQERKLLGTDAALRRILRGEAKPGEFRLLCHCCNLSRGFYGYCPHEESVTSVFAAKFERRNRPAKGTHGTLSAYRWCGPPKCEACKKANRDYNRSKEAALRERRAADLALVV